MTSYQYHMEALRKQRVLERKQEALRRQAMANEDAQKIGNSLQYRTQMNDGNMSLEPDNRKMSFRYDKDMYDHSRDGPVLDATWYRIKKQLQQEDLVLRNGNKIQGCPSSLLELKYSHTPAFK
ncbi:uncharacterized protein LOC141903963 isoform X2 [Tubulanus polymorphus]|uniref:uncharacterized protein LOC141903963 isoform X2 n=1 Tax=Tubulanus polymorphus TaxID=672921 RepID=UPI003DA36EBF